MSSEHLYDAPWPRYVAATPPPAEPAGDEWVRVGSLLPREAPHPPAPAPELPAAPPSATAIPPRPEPIEPELVEVRRVTPPEPPSTALVPLAASAEITLADVARGARRALPALAVAALVTVGVMRAFRKR